MAKPKLKTPRKQVAKKATAQPTSTKKVPVKPAPRTKAKSRRLPGWLQGVVHFYRETMAELKRVQWPTLSEALALTRTVVLVTFLSGLVFGTLDWVFAQVVRFLIGA